MMKAIVYKQAEDVSLQEKDVPNIDDGWVLIKTAYVGICGTDLNIFAGAHPRAKAPLVMGHEFSGTIVKGHPILQMDTPVTVNPLLTCGECNSCINGYSHVCETLKLIGIDCDGAMAEFALVPECSVVPLPPSLSLKAGALAEPVAVAVHAARQGGYLPGAHCVVYGAGTIGLCVALTLRNFGAGNVTIIETNELRLNKAVKLGFDTINSTKVNSKEAILTRTNGSGVEYVFDCAGHPSVIAEITEVVKVRGNIIIVAAYKKPAEMNLLQGMFKELSIQFVRVYTKKDFDIAIELLKSDKNYEKMITHILPPEDAKKGFELLTGKTDAVKVMYQFDGRRE